jgi:hypothetical protein
METQNPISTAKIQKTFKNHLEIVVHYICQLDIEALDMVLDSKVNYMDFEKEKFIKLLGKAFEKFKEKGNSMLKIVPGTCQGCKINESGLIGYTFVGNYSLNYMSLIFEQNNELVSDISECYMFKNMREIKNLSSSITINEYTSENTPGNVLPF